MSIKPQKHYKCNGYELLTLQALEVKSYTKLLKYKVYIIIEVITDLESPSISLKCAYFYNYIPIDWLAAVNSPCIPFSSSVLWSSLWHADSTVLGSSTSLSV